MLINRGEEWKAAHVFYKCAARDDSRLLKVLFVEFINEDGIDGGALKLEFFDIILEQAMRRFFEGENESFNLIPRRGLGSKGLQFEMIGMIVHSVYQGGPGFPHLAPWVFEYLIHGETSVMNDMICKSYISKSAATVDLLELIDKLDMARTNSEINVILEDDDKSSAYWQQINTSEWHIAEVISTTNKNLLIHELIYEVYRRRKDQLS